MDDNQILELARLLVSGTGKNIIFTGAGISTESGIPDYRSKGGIWDQFRPVLYQDFLASREARVEYWRRKAELWENLQHARPNAAHLALAQLHALGYIQAVITQNIDGLHQLAGLPEEAVIELHGNSRRIRCQSCLKLYDPLPVYRRIHQGDAAPECDCSGFLKPDTISFGQQMPLEKLKQAKTLSKHSDVFLVIGSTLQVQPAASLPVYARENHARLAIINLSPTPCDELSHILIRGKAGEVLPRVVDRVREWAPQ